MSSTDFMPLTGWDHVEFWVGNAKQSAYFYEKAFGFTRTAYAGPETGVRDRASYVLEQGEIRFVLTSGLRGSNEVTEFACRHGDGVKEIALKVPSAEEAYRQAVQRGARGVSEPHWVEDEFGSSHWGGGVDASAASVSRTDATATSSHGGGQWPSLRSSMTSSGGSPSSNPSRRGMKAAWTAL